MPIPSSIRSAAHRALAPIAVVLLSTIVMTPAHASCGAESCPLDNTLLSGRSRLTTFEISFQYVEQDQPRTGTEDANIDEIYATGGELRTLSNVTMARAQHYFGERWQVQAMLPFVYREHSHVTAEDLPQPELREWKYSGLGDMTVLGNWIAFGAHADAPLVLGLHGGVKLPTGRKHVPDIDGEEPEPHARPGTGSVDFLMGLNLSRTVSLPT
jgi:hypothetical protein